MSKVTVNIPMNAYLRKYLLYKSVNNREPIIFPPKSDYNMLLRSMVTNWYKENPRMRQPKPQGVEIVLPHDKFKNPNTYNYMSIASQKEFVRHVKRDFFFDFRIYLKECMIMGRQRKDAVIDFLSMLEISEEDLKQESMYRYSSRVLERLKSKK